MAVVVNAYNGEFIETGHFAPRAFLSESAALEHVKQATKLQLRTGKYEASLISSPDAAGPQRLGRRWQCEARCSSERQQRGPFYAKPTDVVRATSMSLDECLELL